MINAYRQFRGETLEPALMVHMINGQDTYLMRKVVQEPRPQMLDEAITKTWAVFRIPLAPLPTHEISSNHRGTHQTQMPHQLMVPTQLDLDFMRPHK